MGGGVSELEVAFHTQIIIPEKVQHYSAGIVSLPCSECQLFSLNLKVHQAHTYGFKYKYVDSSPKD